MCAQFTFDRALQIKPENEDSSDGKRSSSLRLDFGSTSLGLAIVAPKELCSKYHSDTPILAKFCNSEQLVYW